MKVVIDISEEDYKVIQDTVFKYDLNMLSKQSEKDYRNTIILLNLIERIKEGRVLRDAITLPDAKIYSVELYQGCTGCELKDRCMDAFLSTAVNCNNYDKGEVD